MKKIFTLLLVFLSIEGYLFGQEMLGIRNSNYAGLQGLGINPASIRNSRLDIDINIIGIGATVENDFIYVP